MEGKGRPSSYKTITIEKKLQILLETDQPDSTIRGVARKHGISPFYLFIYFIFIFIYNFELFVMPTS